MKRKSLTKSEHTDKKIKSEKTFDNCFINESAIIESTFLLKCPSDFFHFFSFCREISPQSPLLVLEQDLNIVLVGPFEILAEPKAVQSNDDLTCLYRFFHDPPEFVTVMTSKLDNLFHIGYFRDDYNEKPSFMASSVPSKSGKLHNLGYNIFSVVAKLFERNDDTKMSTILKQLIVYASNHSINIKTKSINRKVVCNLLNGVGLKINLNNDIGYRPVPISSRDLVNILSKIVKSTDEKTKLKHQAKLDELITLVQFANDEGDYGEGLELGLNLLAYHPSDCLQDATYFNGMITHLLSTGYFLAGRPKFADVIQRHMKNRSIKPVSINKN